MVKDKKGQQEEVACGSDMVRQVENHYDSVLGKNSLTCSAAGRSTFSGWRSYGIGNNL